MDGHRVSHTEAAHIDRSRHLSPNLVLVFLEPDVALDDYVFLVFQVEVPLTDAPDYVQAHRAWSDELLRCYPSPRRAHVCLELDQVGP